MLARAAKKLPPIPSLVAEQLHVALLSGDRGAVAASLPAARTWGRLYPFTEPYIARAEEMLATAK